MTIYCLVKKIGKSSDVYKDVVSVGKPILNTKFRIVDDKLNCVTNNTEGELVVSGVQLMRGYKNSQKKTQEVIVNINGSMYYKTGDLAFLDNRKNCYITGRKDDTVKISGFRVNLSDVDSYIHKLDYVKDSCTIYIDNLNSPSYLVSYVILNIKTSNINIFQDLKNILPDFQMPKYIEDIKEFPLNNSGKIHKKELLKKFKFKYNV